MSDVIDPRLKYLQGKKKRELASMSLEGRFGLDVERVDRRIEAQVKVLVQYEGDIAALEDAGMEVRTVAGDVIAGQIHMDNLAALSAVEGMVRIESSRPLVRELDISVPEIKADQVHVGPPGLRGAGVIIGIIDSGIDFTHGCFRQAAGATRILAIWDQSLTPQGGESSPAGFNYGVEYTRTDISAALNAPNPHAVVRHVDRSTTSGHGTHVAGIAAGNGAPGGGGQPANTFIGVAPEANIIVVNNRVTTESFGDSSQTLDAVNYIFRKADLLDMPVVINLSQGDNIGPHDGTSLLERGIDNLLGDPGKIMVKSAGNEGGKNRHAMGEVPAGGSVDIGLSAFTNDRRDNIIDIWYAGADRFDFRITPPGGPPSAEVKPGDTKSIDLDNGNNVFVDSTLDDTNNHDNRIYITVSPGTAATIENGVWTITLTGQTVTNGQFHAWIERSNEPTFQFRRPFRANSHTISIPGTSREVIAVGAYITEGAGIGNLSTFSSRGPTRDGLPKPEIGAPGAGIMSARAPGISLGSGLYHAISGTSMAAPHVTGVVALMLQKNDTLTQQQVRDCLMNNARNDAFTGPTPNYDWGAGKIDALAAVNCVQISTLIKFLDDGATAIKFVDDGATPFKFLDDGGAQGKPLGDVSTAVKVLDDGATANKLLDDGGTPNKAFDDVKQPALDKPPLADTPAGTQPGRAPLPAGPGETGEAEAAPFVMSTPHHATGWQRQLPAGFQQQLARYQQAIQQLEATMMQVKPHLEAGTLSAAEEAQVVQLDQQYRNLLAEYRQLLRSAGLA